MSMSIVIIMIIIYNSSIELHLPSILDHTGTCTHLRTGALGLAHSPRVGLLGGGSGGLGFDSAVQFRESDLGGGGEVFSVAGGGGGQVLDG